MTHNADRNNVFKLHHNALYRNTMSHLAEEQASGVIGSFPQDAGGGRTSLRSLEHIDVAILGWHLAHDRDHYLYHLLQHSRLIKSLYERRASGDSINQSYFSPTVVRHIFCMIAGRCYDTAIEVTHEQGRLSGQQDLMSQASDFECAWWRAAFHFLMGTNDALFCITEFKRFLAAHGGASLMPLPEAMEIVLEGRHNDADSALKAIVEGHKAVYRDEDPDNIHALLCLNGIAMANIMTRRGWSITYDDEFLPSALIDMA